ncbi:MULTISPECIES: hypothetical protein [unclassified Rhizobium]|uniref:hypothetical protein n=1 Tax=unclassified Rhizobium TaxID=2613769 RepID=UPI000714ED97|nr:MULTISPECIES: hypothetical protein [unclassified Rhizobium]KQS90864.1 hypothetical protein ASG42_10165 [Rhizobium sp. Leaf391]KQS95952.1 hypothetical protein ASG50_02385 [Rhizobium sp. Leaf386]KQU09973.1 hypothetical protein ASG68_02985 [Rhizobium sp. Leaf453]
MMHGGSKSIGARNAKAGGHELEDYFAGLDDGNPEPRAGTPANVDPFAEKADRWSAQRRELRRLTAYAAHLKQEISKLAPTSSPSGEVVQPPSARPAWAGGLAAALLIAAVAAGLLTFHLSDRR